MSLRVLSDLRFSAAAAALLLACTPARAQTLAADTPSAPYHTVVHLTASAAPAGSITFADNGSPIATVPVSPQGTAVLGIATLAPGTHTLTAAHSNPVTVTVTAAPVSFQFTPDNTLLFDHTTLNFALTGLPPRATGTLTYAEDGAPFAIVDVSRAVPVPAYQAVGDSITAGFTLASSATRYPDLFAAANAFPNYLNLADSGAVTCDLLPRYLLPVAAGPTQDVSPLYTLLVGTNDMDRFGVPLGEPNFTACHLATLAWLAIPREYKVLATDPAAAILSGAWSRPPEQLDSTYATLYNDSGTGTAQFALTSNGGPLYLWYLIGDHLTGAFTLALDGVPTGTTYTTHPDAPIVSRNNPDSTGFVLLRLPVAPGPHTLRVDMVSGTVGILAAATPPSPGAASVHPTVLAADVPNENLTQATAKPSAILQYSADALADIALLAADGLDLRAVPTHTFLTGDAANFDDFAHPSTLGQQHLDEAFQAVFAGTSTLPFLTYGATIPRPSLLVTHLGTHTYTAAYSGDSIYAPYTASTSVQIVPDSQSITTLTTPATTFYAGRPVTATAGIFPPNPGATVTLLDGGRPLANALVDYKSAAFSLASLAPGRYTLSAAYGGDFANAASASPPLAIQVLQNSSTVLLSAPAHTAYADGLTLTAALQPGTGTGSVVFTDSFTPNDLGHAQAPRTLGSASVAGGNATLTLTGLAPGTHTLTAAYAGDTNDTPATSNAATTLIDRIPTGLAAGAATAPRGQASTFTATVSPAAATGNVTFTDAVTGTTLSAALAGGTASVSSSTFTSGSHAVMAVYSGDATYASSTGTLTVSIPRAPSSATLTTSAASLYTGNPVTLTAAVNPAAASGTVLFTDAAAGTLGQAGLAAGTAALTLPSLPPGRYNVVATYQGDTDTLPSASAPVAIQVLTKTTTTTLTAPPSAVYATPVTLTATVANAPASALIAFSDNGTLLGTTALTSAATATYTTSTLAGGAHILTAAFAGDSTHDPSNGSASLTITPATSTITLSLSQSTILAGSPASVSIRVATTGTIPTGTVTLRSATATIATIALGNGSGGAAYANAPLPTGTAGIFPLTASYSGDQDASPSDASIVYTVAPRIAGGTLTLSAGQVPPQTPVTLSAAFTSPGTAGPALVPTGTVTFYIGTSALTSVPLDANGQATAVLPSAALGTYTISAVYAPTGVFTASAVPVKTLTVTPPLAVAFTTSAITMDLASGAPATATANVTTLSGYQGAFSTQCSSPQAYLTCTVDSPATVTGTATVQVHLALVRTHAALTLPGIARTAALALLLPLLFTRRRRLPALLLLLLAATLATGLTGCGEGGSFGQIPTGAYQVQLTATAANTPATAILKVTVQ